MGIGYLAALATLACWTVSTMVLAVVARSVDVYVMNKAALFIALVLLGAWVCSMDKLTPWQLVSYPDASNWLWLGISGILGKSIGDYAGFRSLRILGARRRSMTATLGPGFTWFFGFVLLGETINGLGLAGMFITALCLVLLIQSVAESREIEGDNYGSARAGLLFGCAAAMLTGLAFVLAKKNLLEPQNRLSVFHATWIRILTAWLALAVFDFIKGNAAAFWKPFVASRRLGFMLLTGVVFGAVLGLSLSLLAIMQMNAAEAYTIFSLLPVTIMLANFVLFGQRVSRLSWLYSLLAIAGVWMLIWREPWMAWLQSRLGN